METQRIDKKVCSVLSTGSEGNCVRILETILVDVGVSFSKIKDFYTQLQLITWSHGHIDHFNANTIKRLIKERPTLRVAVCEHEKERALMCGAKNLDILKHGQWYDYGSFQIATFQTYHDIPSNGYRIKNEKYKIFFATDTAHLNGIEAKNYTHYCIEHNFNEDTVFDTIRELEAAGKFAHQRGAINSHLSEQKARDFIHRNAGENYKVLRLHESKTN